MPTPFQSAVPQVINIEDEGDYVLPYSGNQGLSKHELMEMFRKGVQRQLELRKKQDNTSGSANPPPAVQPSPPSAPTRAKRLSDGPPPGFAGVRQPPHKHHRQCSRPPWQRGQQAPQQGQKTHHFRGPSGSSPVNVSAGVPLGRSGRVPFISRSTAGRPSHSTAAIKKPPVPCSLCGVLCMTTRHLREHEQGRKHRNKVACLAGKMMVQCQLCNVHLSGALNVKQHYAGKQHRGRLNRAD